MDDVAAREALALADPATLRAAGFDVADGEGDCVNPSDEWRERVAKWIAAERQRRAVMALRDLTKDDVRALLEVLR